MADNLFINGQVKRVRIASSSRFVVETENCNFWLEFTEPLDFKNQVLWAYEKYLRQKKEEADEQSKG